MWSTNYSEGFAHLVIFCSDNLRSRHVYQFKISFGIHHKILRFDISADYLVVIEVLQNKDDACSIKLAVISWEQTNFPHDLIEILSTDILRQIEEIVFRLEGFTHLIDKRKSNSIEYFLLLVYKFLDLVLF